MRKNICYFAAVFFVSMHAFALTDLELSGEADISAAVSQLPTGSRGNSAFSIPAFFLKMDAPLKEENSLVTTLEGSEEKIGAQERFNVRLREAYVDLVSIFAKPQALRFGLFPQPWQEAQYEIYPYRFLGKDAWTITEKWNYLNYSDLGFSYSSSLPSDIGDWAFSVSNGEGAYEKENGPHKEASLFARFYFAENWRLMANYLRGNYELYGEDINLKERIQAAVIFESKNVWTIGLEYLATQDPADSFEKLNMAEGVDLLAQTGQVVRGQGVSLFTVVSTGPKAEVMLRYDYLNAAIDVESKDLQTFLLSLGYQVSEDIKAALVVDYTKYGNDFSPGMRDRSKITLASQILF